MTFSRFKKNQTSVTYKVFRTAFAQVLSLSQDVVSLNHVSETFYRFKTTFFCHRQEIYSYKYTVCLNTHTSAALPAVSVDQPLLYT